MSIQDLGAIGELIAALGVLISLIYLAMQIRQNSTQITENTNAVKASAVSTGLQLIFDNRIAIFATEETTLIFEKGTGNPHDLNTAELIRYRMMMANALDALFNTYSQTKASGFSPETWDGAAKTTRRLLSTQGGKWFWETYKQEYNRSFQVEVNRITNSDSSDDAES